MVADSAGSSTVATKQLAGKYGVDVELLERLVRFVNVPSEREVPLGGAGSVRDVRNAESGEDIPVREVSSFLLYELMCVEFFLFFSLFFLYLLYRWSGGSQRKLLHDDESATSKPYQPHYVV
jgi:hypothetical protein